MGIAITPELETKLRSNAAAEGVSVEEYLARLVKLDQQAISEFQTVIAEALDSGNPFEPGPGYWEEKHRKLEKRLKSRQ